MQIKIPEKLLEDLLEDEIELYNLTSASYSNSKSRRLKHYQENINQIRALLSLPTNPLN